jgi:hypothetical protein
MSPRIPWELVADHFGSAGIRGAHFDSRYTKQIFMAIDNWYISNFHLDETILTTT